MYLDKFVRKCDSWGVLKAALQLCDKLHVLNSMNEKPLNVYANRNARKSLEQLGVKTELAHNIACSRKGYQLICKTDWLKFAINNERLRKRGLVFLLDQYNKVHIECTN